MTYKLTIETDSLEEIFNAVSNLRDKATATIASEEKPKKKTKDKIAEEIKAVVLVKNEEVAKETSKVADLAVNREPPEGAKTTDVPYEEVAKVTLELVKIKGKKAALGILANYKSKKDNTTPAQGAPELKPEDFADYVSKVTAAMGE